MSKRKNKPTENQQFNVPKTEYGISFGDDTFEGEEFHKFNRVFRNLTGLDLTECFDNLEDDEADDEYN